MEMRCFILVLLGAALPGSGGDAEVNNFVYRQLQMNRTYDDIYVNSTTEAILHFDTHWQFAAYPTGQPARITVRAADVRTNQTYPLFITATQQSTSASWQLPMLVDSERRHDVYTSFSRTLCPPQTEDESNWPLVHVTTRNPETVAASIYVEMVEEFHISIGNEDSDWKTVEVASNSPTYYAFRFDANLTSHSGKYVEAVGATLKVPIPKIKSPETVILMLESDDDACMTVSVQNLTCPVYVEEKDIKHRGDYFTMMSKGGITISQARYAVGFYVVLMMTSSEHCVGSRTSADVAREGSAVSQPVRKTVRLKIVATISYADYAVAATAMLGALAALGAVMLAAASVGRLYSRGASERALTVVVEDASDEATLEGTSEQRNGAGPTLNRAVSSESDDELLNVGGDGRTDAPVKMSLSRLSRQSVAALKSRSDKYLYGVLIISVFYSLPVVQLIVTYQAMLQDTGNQDLCYYNFLCAHPLGLLSDFNHVFSNVGYVTLGVAFAVVVRRRQIFYKRRPQLQSVGIPQHFGMYYAMGWSLVVEGVLSASYHFCPNKMNFQFDSSFMYVMAVLILVKLYQNRHPDVNASAHATFGVLACLILIGSSEVLVKYVSLRSYTAYWILVCHVKLAFFIYISFHIYYVGRWKITDCVPAMMRVCRRDASAQYNPRPIYPVRLYLLCLVNAANYAFDVYGMWMASHGKRDLPVHILQVLLMNAVLYTAIYMLMKLYHGERIAPGALALLLGSNALWATGVYLFAEGRTKWAWTPAQSRGRNAPCSLLQFYDTHDGWHLASAAAMLLTFLLLLVVDDDIADTSRREIAVF